MELELTNVARASLEDLRLDYEDFLRQRGLPRWDRADPRRQTLIDRRPQTAADVAPWVREVHDQGGRSGSGGSGGQGGQGGPNEPASTVSTPSTYPEIAANAVLILIAVATALLGRQLAAQAAHFDEHGGFTERLYRTRRDWRKGS